MITIKLPSGEIQKITATLDRIAAHCNKQIGDIVDQASYFAVQTAAKNTVPMVRTLADKHKYRPIFKSKNGFFQRYYYKVIQSGKILILKAKLSNKSQARAGLSFIDKAIGYWSKKNNFWDYMPYSGNATKYDKTIKKGKIPHAGIARKGWLLALPKITTKIKNNNLNYDFEKGDTGATNVRKFYTMLKKVINITNNIEYVSKTSPNCAIKGIQAAEARMRSIYLKKLEADIKRMAA